MAKRKAGVNDIIYELDNDDIVISSDDEGKDPKKIHLEPKITKKSTLSEEIKDPSLFSDNTIEIIDDNDSKDQSPNLENGGKQNDNNDCTQNHVDSKIIDENVNKNFNCNKVTVDSTNTTLYNEDIIIDSPASNTDLGVVGCENRTPLVSLRFKDSNFARNYKKKVKEFLLNLIKLHEGDNSNISDNDTDIELDIWPEDLVEDDLKINESSKEEDNFFFIDTAPCDVAHAEIPQYSQLSSVISNSPEKQVEPQKLQRRGPSCFNCDGPHSLSACHLPRDHARIAENRKNITAKVGRYHVEDDQKYGHLVPGRISGELRNALGLKRNELPLYIYRMRMLGYPPGWLEEARISHSGITMFDSTGSAILDPEEEDGEVCEPGSKDKFDIKKILDFPGFNVPASSRYVEEGHLYGLPPISEQDSKLAMLQTLAPNAMKAYKRKKLTFFPSAERNSLQGQAEMELDSGDEIPEFPSVPPLPDEAPPPPPPPPTSPPPQPPSPTLDSPGPQIPTEDLIVLDEDMDDTISDEVEIIEVMKVMDIPIPEDDLITLDDDSSQLNSSHDSLSLDDLEEKKRLLLNALDTDTISLDTTIESIPDTKSADEGKHIEVKSECKDDTNTENKDIEKTTAKNEIEKDTEKNKVENDTAKIEVKKDETKEGSKEMNTPKIEKPRKDVGTPDTKAGQVKETSYGTPLMNIASPYLKLPSDDKFAKDICDIINFENLPNSTGKYKKICTLLKKVKNEVDRIQES